MLENMFQLATNYVFSLDKDSNKSLRYFLLLSNIEKYINGAIIEMQRISKSRLRIIKKFKAKTFTKDYSLIYLANDTHFYFICIDKVYKLVTRLAKELKDPEIKKLKNRISTIFRISKVRNHLEHIDARSVGFLTKNESEERRTLITDFGNFINDDFSFNGELFPSSKDSLFELKQIYRDLVKILERKYASKDPHFVQRKESEKVYKAIMEKLRKTGLFERG